MFPAQPMNQKRAEARAKAIENKLKTLGLENCVTEHGLKVFGLKPWNTE